MGAKTARGTRGEMLTTTRTRKSPCPRCGRECDAATSTEPGKVPEPGSVSICAYCGEINLFDEDLILRRLTLAELTELQSSSVWPLIERARMAALRAFQGAGER